MSDNLVCSLCLKEIEEQEDKIVIGEKIRHLSCHTEYEEMIVELAKIYDETCDQDI